MDEDPHRSAQRHPRPAARVRLVAPVGAGKVQQRLAEILENRQNHLPARVLCLIRVLWQEIQELESRVTEVEQELAWVAQEIPILQQLRKIAGVGLLTATALYASVGNIHSFPSGRHLASWLGLTPNECSSGGRRLGPISKRGDVYLRTLLTHGARSALLTAQRRRCRGQPLTRIQRWAAERAEHQHPNQAAIALANRMARVIWAVWHHERAFDGNYLPAAA
jgi:transposase